MSRTVHLTLIAPFLLAAPALAQQTRTLTGTVGAGEQGIPFAGAEIRLVDSGTRVCADARGNFSIPVPATGETRLRITPVGFEPKEVVVLPGDASVEVALGDHVFILDEVRVVGYSTSLGTARASGNSIARLEGKDIDGVPAQTIEGAMQGKVAGAYIQSNSGQPGGGYSIILRGINTILGSPDPMVIVDGVVVSTAGIPSGSNAVTGAGRFGQESASSRLADINPADVDRIEVLRGPSASAMYGSKASNGVILITTKRGGVPVVDTGNAGDVLRCFLPGSGMLQIR